MGKRAGWSSIILLFGYQPRSLLKYIVFVLNIIVLNIIWFSFSGSCPSSESKYFNSGVINSPRWPRVYTTIGSCYWKIEVGSNKAVKIAFMDFDLDYDFGCDDEKVKVKGEPSKWLLITWLIINK